ncbi:heavy metal translocating P-type ATPase [Fimbriimonas ginsengisoli]|uniref:Heavy metal translocating P-type ATPase n=1 Tax=Fimbriimonas ginsengisoli Gsoil 348 TaxID=661478 RepID=A0A068NT33_FIMGI|nr:cation-translocating P-type ATPase [Fimbriimonas ginsengisoli]AIE86556.1 heavy metal translocating P-type ATPase [Fimbriimonas ginsengisoli Gsoil 348]
MLAFLRSVHGALTALCGLALLLCLIPGYGWCAYVAVAAGSYFAIASAWESLREREVDVNLLMVLAAGGAIVVGQPVEAGILLFLFSLSSALEELAMARTKSAIEALVRLRPDEAILIRPAGDERVPVATLRVGDRVRVLPFQSIPADGVVAEGQSAVDQSAMTGESIPVSKAVQDRVLAGTQNLEGMLVVVVSAELGDTTLDKIVGLVQEAQENKASGERISTWFGQRYTFFVLGAFALSLVVRSIIGESWPVSLRESLTLLVALSPCALVISTPATTLSALTFAARHGMLVRGGEFIELAGTIDTVILDKTGTLTEGKPRLVEICVCSGGPEGCRDESACWHGGGEPSPAAAHMLRLAACAEKASTHPLAGAIVEAAGSLGLELQDPSNAAVVPGSGVECDVDGVHVKVGQQRFFPNLDPSVVTHVAELQGRGMTVAILQVGDRYAALGMRDTPREGVQDTLEGLRSLGVKQILMLTGDSRETAEAVASEVGICEFRAGLLPDDKTAAIRDLIASGHRTLMVGDGVNDAPSLAISTIGVAMGGLGSDVALQSADVVLMHDRLDRIPLLIRLGRSTNATVRANLYFAASVIVVLTSASLLGRLPLPLAVVGHEGSTVLVILNGLRMLRGPREA